MKSFQSYLNVSEEYEGSYICCVPSERYKDERQLLVNPCSILSRDLSAVTAVFPQGVMFLCLKEYCLLCELMICLEDGSLTGEDNCTAFMMDLSNL